MAAEVGTPAPDFTAKDQNKVDVALADFRDKKAVLLVFYPFAFSSICTNELRAVRDQLPKFQNDDVQILAVSTDPTFSLKAFATAEGYEFPLLSDFWPHGELARTYGVFNDGPGMANRGTFLIDRGGVVRFTELNEPGMPRDQGDWLDAVAKLA